MIFLSGICDCIRDAELDLWLIPSRIGGMVADAVQEMIDSFDPKGIVWDELKSLDGQDHSKEARAALNGRPANKEDMLKGTVECFGKINKQLRTRNPELNISVMPPIITGAKALLFWKPSCRMKRVWI